MSNEALSAVAKADIRPSGRKFVAMALADYADEAWSCFPSVEQLARYTSQGEKTVRDHLDALEEAGILTRERQRRDDGTLGRYRFKLHRRNLPVAKIANGEKQPEPAAKSATHNPQTEPSSIPSARVNAEFEDFWSLYPNKVGKRAAEKSFNAARKRISQADLMAGLVAYVNKRDDRPWCNPATWLNQDRWEDRPAQRPVQAHSPPTRASTSALADSAARLAQTMRTADEIRSGSSGSGVRAAIPHLSVR